VAAAVSLFLGVVVPTNSTINNASVNDDDTNPGWVDGLAIITAVIVVAFVTVHLLSFHFVV
jgi:hypothetical protein